MKLAEEINNRSEALFKSIVNTARDAIIVIDTKSRILFWNKTAEQMFGYSSKEVLGKELTCLMPKRHSISHKKGVERYMKTGKNKIIGTIYETEAIRKDGSEFPIQLSVAQWRYNSRLFFSGIIRDITERRRKEEIIKHLAYHDSLTNLPNRRLLQDRMNLTMAHAQRTGQKFAVLYLDIDEFKLVNDVFGHEYGDILLKRSANRLQNTLRKEDTVARMGGDEYVILLPEIDSPQAAATVAQKINERLLKIFVIKKSTFYISVSIGISVYPYDGYAATSLIRKADEALYRAKRAGKNTYRFFNEDLAKKAA